VSVLGVFNNPHRAVHEGNEALSLSALSLSLTTSVYKYLLQRTLNLVWALFFLILTAGGKKKEENQHTEQKGGEKKRKKKHKEEGSAKLGAHRRDGAKGRAQDFLENIHHSIQ
jgi:hypothetical protein